MEELFNLSSAEAEKAEILPGLDGLAVAEEQEAAGEKDEAASTADVDLTSVKEKMSDSEGLN